MFLDFEFSSPCVVFLVDVAGQSFTRSGRLIRNTMSTAFRQDMPPPGGYAPIYFQRVPPKKFFNGWILFAAYCVITPYSYWRYMKWKYYLKKLDVEKYDSLIAMQPFIDAEQDRSFLRQLWINREEEKKLMKDFPGWKTGTLYGEPLFKTIKPNDMPDVTLAEIYAHRWYMDTYNTAWPDIWV